MIPVRAAPEPAHFDKCVRRKGLDAIAELVGEARSRPRPGPARKKRANRREKIRANQFPPIWTDVLPDMMAVYHCICAYTALHIEEGTGDPTVDHFVPKSQDWTQVYEWSNYRLACGLVNSKKGERKVVFDPFSIPEGLFALEFVGYQVIAGPCAQGDMARQVQETIEHILGLNTERLLKQRREYVSEYWAKHINWDYLQRKAPFVAQELKRQKMLLPGDE